MKKILYIKDYNMGELKANLDKDAVSVKHSNYDYVIYDSSIIEKPFVLALNGKLI